MIHPIGSQMGTCHYPGCKGDTPFCTPTKYHPRILNVVEKRAIDDLESTLHNIDVQLEVIKDEQSDLTERRIQTINLINKIKG